jgi:hypothetical protein
MKRRNFINLRVRKRVSITAAAAVLAGGGVAFALLMSQAVLTGNSISTESAGLLISQNDSYYGPTTSGYAFTGIIPGSQASQTEHFLLKNVGSAVLALNMSLTSTPTNPDGVDPAKIHIILTPFSMDTYLPGAPQDLTLQSLLDAGAGGVAVDYPSPLPAGAKEEFNIQVGMDEDAVSGNNGALLSNIDFGFTGTAGGGN